MVGMPIERTAQVGTYRRQHFNLRRILGPADPHTVSNSHFLPPISLCQLQRDQLPLIYRQLCHCSDVLEVLACRVLASPPSDRRQYVGQCRNRDARAEECRHRIGANRQETPSVAACSRHQFALIGKDACDRSQAGKTAVILSAAMDLGRAASRRNILRCAQDDDCAVNGYRMHWPSDSWFHLVGDQSGSARHSLRTKPSGEQCQSPYDMEDSVDTILDLVV